MPRLPACFGLQMVSAHKRQAVSAPTYAIETFDRRIGGTLL